MEYINLAKGGIWWTEHGLYSIRLKVDKKNHEFVVEKEGSDLIIKIEPKFEAGLYIDPEIGRYSWRNLKNFDKLTKVDFPKWFRTEVEYYVKGGKVMVSKIKGEFCEVSYGMDWVTESTPVVLNKILEFRDFINKQTKE